VSYERLLKIKKSIFSLDDVASVLGIRLESAAVLCSRYVQKGLLTRLKRGLYTRTEALNQLTQEDLFRVANILQVPSYISLMTALSYYGLTTQLQRGVFESISLKRTRKFNVGRFSFRYVKIQPSLYQGFERKAGFFIAFPEKAILDSFYLDSIGRYPLDKSSLDLTKADKQAAKRFYSAYPTKTINYFERALAESTRS
jgi:predicted transcriptional regulator of viral defense system